MTTIKYLIKKEDSPCFEEHGFTLLETLMALAIFSILLGSIYFVMNTYSKTFTAQDVRVINQQTMRTGLDLMTREIRFAGFDPSGKANTGIVAATSTSLQITADDNENETVDSNEDIEYKLIGSTLQVRDASSADYEDLIKNVTAFQFSYFDSQGNDLGAAPADLSDIESIGILLTVEEPAGREGTITRTMTTQVQCRNLTYD